ncbi:hypothetical protein [Prescottella equi]|uniref:hypothetical protein n=1 Tax=Rhodococcus hoagii TaxID=43767 RepID=UPI0007CD6748|nr:hypothetical protein [Prescottella equi]MBM4590286.1 hypothetical protein [Prescottella equi]MBM4632095.1 hypothetical protein [Prescottella equi]MBM4632524.1 hypothetical protein [Prescottella equi]MBM4632528.1 hypothetical protein [Prescottella equi]MBM4696261.1 hypothetical protein [Prescottella equi]
MTVNQRAIIRGLNTWLLLTLALGIVTQIIEFANAPEVCFPSGSSSFSREICRTGDPTVYGIGLAIFAVIGLISVAQAKRVLTPAGPPMPSPEFIAKKR